MDIDVQSRSETDACGLRRCKPERGVGVRMLSAWLRPCSSGKCTAASHED